MPFVWSVDVLNQCIRRKMMAMEMTARLLLCFRSRTGA
jgi:hypothetical protein